MAWDLSEEIMLFKLPIVGLEAPAWGNEKSQSPYLDCLQVKRTAIGDLDPLIVSKMEDGISSMDPVLLPLQEKK